MYTHLSKQVAYHQILLYDVPARRLLGSVELNELRTRMMIYDSLNCASSLPLFSRCNSNKPILVFRNSTVVYMAGHQLEVVYTVSLYSRRVLISGVRPAEKQTQEGGSGNIPSRVNRPGNHGVYGV